MSGRYAEAVSTLEDEQHLLGLIGTEGYEDPEPLVEGARHAVQRAQALALLALAEEVEALVELLRERLPVQDVTVDPDRGIGVCDVCETGVFPGQSVATTPEGGLRHGWCAPSTAPSFEVLEAMGPRCVTCSIRRDLHVGRVDLGHAWNGGGSA